MMIMTGMTMAFKLGIMGYWDYGGNDQYEDDDNNFNFEKDNQLDDDGGDNDVDANDCELAKHAMAVSVTMTQNLHQKAIGGYAQSTVCCRVNLLKNNDYNFLPFSLE